MGWLSRVFAKPDEPKGLELNDALLREASQLEGEQKVQSNLLRLQGREIRQQMIQQAIDIRNRQAR